MIPFSKTVIAAREKSAANAPLERGEGKDTTRQKNDNEDDKNITYLSSTTIANKHKLEGRNLLRSCHGCDGSMCRMELEEAEKKV